MAFVAITGMQAFNLGNIENARHSIAMIHKASLEVISHVCVCVCSLAIQPDCAYNRHTYIHPYRLVLTCYTTGLIEGTFTLEVKHEEGS